MTAWTPGPWTAENVGESEGWSVTSDTEWNRPRHGDDSSRLSEALIAENLREADARLIAEAPAMAEALRNMCERATYDGVSGTWTIKSSIDGIIAEACTILARLETPRDR